MKKVLSILLALGAGFSASANVYNIVDAFQLNSSSNPPWSMGWRNGSSSTLQLMNKYKTEAYTNGVASAWQTTVYQPSALGVYRNYNNFQLIGNDVAKSIIPANSLMIHPEVGAIETVIRFKVPVTGVYKIESSVARLSQYAGSAKVIIYRGGQELDTSTVTSNGYEYQDRPTLTLSIAANELIDFVVNANGDPFGDSTGVRAKLTVVPEPLTIAALGTGLVALFRRKPSVHGSA